MLSVFSKRLLVVPVAGFFLSMGAHSMEQNIEVVSQQQTGCKTGLVLPPVEIGGMTCRIKRNEMTFLVKSGSTVEVRKRKKLECTIKQKDHDGDSGGQTYEDSKSEGVDFQQIGGEDQSQRQVQGYQCDSDSVKVTRDEWSTKTDGEKTTEAEYEHLTDIELKIHNGDAVLKHLPTGDVDPRAIMAQLNAGFARMMSLEEAEEAMLPYIARLEEAGGLITIIEKGDQVIVKNGHGERVEQKRKHHSKK